MFYGYVVRGGGRGCFCGPMLRLSLPPEVPAIFRVWEGELRRE